MSEEQTSRLNLRIDEDLRKAIEEAAERDHRTVSQWVRLAVLRALEDAPKES